MANAFLKPEVIVRTALGLLEREVVLPSLVWRDTGINFEGAKNDTVSIRVPAYAVARTRVLRAAGPITLDELEETKIDVTLDTDVYKAVAITDEELTLDIANFGEQVLNPVVASVARGIENLVATEFTAGTYETTIAFDVSNPYDTIVDARIALNDANVPPGGRTLLVGSWLEGRILKADQFVKVDQSGSDSALREAVIGRIAGFNVIPSNAIPGDEAYAFHRTALILSTRAPVAPEGATWASSATFAGLSMRLLRDYDFMNVRDRLLANMYAGTALVTDAGDFDAEGKFVPDADATPIVVRAVKIAGVQS